MSSISFDDEEEYEYDIPDEDERKSRTSNVGEGLYRILELPKTATNAEIRMNYKKLSVKHHPDKNPDRVKQATKEMQKINHAYRVLNDPKLRVIYDTGGSTALRTAEQVGPDPVYGLCKGPWWLRFLFVVFGLVTCCYFCFCCCCCCWCCGGKCCTRKEEDLYQYKDRHASKSGSTTPRESTHTTTTAGTTG